MAAKVMTPTVRAPILLHQGARVVFTLSRARVFLLVSFHKKKKKKKSLILKSRISFLFSPNTVRRNVDVDSFCFGFSSVLALYALRRAHQLTRCCFSTRR